MKVNKVCSQTSFRRIGSTVSRQMHVRIRSSYTHQMIHSYIYDIYIYIYIHTWHMTYICVCVHIHTYVYMSMLQTYAEVCRDATSGTHIEKHRVTWDHSMASRICKGRRSAVHTPYLFKSIELDDANVASRCRSLWTNIHAPWTTSITSPNIDETRMEIQIPNAQLPCSRFNRCVRKIRVFEFENAVGNRDFHF